MKKILFLSAWLLWAQNPRKWLFGAQVGLNIPAYRSSERIDKAVVMPGFTGGLSVKYAYSPKWVLHTGLYFSQRNSAYLVRESYPEDTTIGTFQDSYTVHVSNDGRLELAHVELPILIQWNFLNMAHSRSYFLGGAHVGYRLFFKNYGQTQVALEGLDFLPLFGFSPQTRLIVAEGPIQPGKVDFRRGDLGLWVGGGNSYRMGSGEMSFEIRAFTGIVNIFRIPSHQRFYNGSVMFLTGYHF
ncbi:MAG: PorT family protein [Bacteroidia bacterium]|nr:PorT family protein [Bacteroidia bacterium]MCX7652477.1 PorT family protein [Bacteroidia bacterium]MDW8416879.1 outer membrane beta-barrel protein [Bacteroidia bacterium]